MEMMKTKRKKSFASILLFCAVTAILTLGGCGVDDNVSPPASTTVSGVAAAGKAIHGTVTLKDSSKPSKIKTTVTGDDGSFVLNVDGLRPPYILQVKWEDENAATLRLHSLARKHGKTNINPLSDVVVAGAAGSDDPTLVFNSDDPAAIEAAAAKLMAALESLRTVLAPMFQLYNYDKNPIDDDFEADHTGLDALFDDVRIYVASGMIIVRNKRTNSLIFSAPINNIAAGTFYENNLPVRPGTLNGATLYANKCASCHGALAPGKKGATAAEIQAAIAANTGGMGSLSSLTALEIQAIATFLTPTPPPPAPIDGAALYSSKCGSCHGALATSDMKGATASAIQSAINSNRGGMGSLSTLTADQIADIAAALATTTPPPAAACTYTYDVWGTCQSNGTQTRTVLSSTPAGCTGTPVLTQTCTYVPGPAACTYTYNAWGACQSNNTQTRTVATSSPAGCVGIPVLTQSCTYVPPTPAACTSFTYSAWGACQSNNTQTRTQLTASPAGCTGGTPVLSQTCTYVPPAPACGSCHAIPPGTGAHSFHVSSRGYACSTCHGTGYSSTAVNAATHANGVSNVVSTLNFNATTSTCGSPGCHGSRTW